MNTQKVSIIQIIIWAGIVCGVCATSVSAQNCILSVYSSGASDVAISSSTGHGGTTDYQLSVPRNTTVTLTAPETVDGRTFKDWTGMISSTNRTITFTMDTPKYVTANYQAPNCVLSVYSSGASGVAISSSTGHGGTTDYQLSVPRNTTVTLTAPVTADGKSFKDWTGMVTNKNRTITFIMDTPKYVTANYEDQPELILVDDNFSMPKSSGNVVLDVLANDTLVGESIIDSYDDPTAGSLIIDYVDGKSVLIYNPPEDLSTLTFDENGKATVTFTYTVDGHTATVTITVINNIPVAVGDLATTNQGQSVVIAVLSNDTDPDYDDVLTVIEGTVTPNNGTLVLNANGTFTYTPDEGFLGNDSFSYMVTDGFNTSSEVLVNINVVNNQPSMYTLVLSSTEGGQVIEPGEGIFEYSYGDYVTLEAQPDSGYHFVEWTGSYGSESNPLTIIMDQDYNITANFEADEKTEQWSFVQITDIHIGIRQPQADEKLLDFVYLLNNMSQKPDLVLVTGDIVDCAWLQVGDLQIPIGAFSRYVEIMSQLDNEIKVHEVPGNHDRYIFGYDEWDYIGDDAWLVFKSLDLSLYHYYLNSSWHEFEHKGIRFIGLDSGKDTGLDPDIGDIWASWSDLTGEFFRGTGLTNDDIGWLEGFDPSEPKIIFMHHPAINSPMDEWTISQNQDTFIDYYCKDNNVLLVLAGHTHNDIIFDRSGVSTNYPLFIQTPAMCDGFYRKFNVSSPPQPEHTSFVPCRSKITTALSSHANMHVFDSVGRHVGINTSGNNERGIPESYYLSGSAVDIGNQSVTIFPEKIVIYEPADNYYFGVEGYENGTYELDITFQNNDEEANFKAAGIPISLGAEHVYVVDWDTLAAGEEGVIVEIDADGDGIFERTVYADNDLTSDEYSIQMSFDPNEPNALKIQNFVKQFFADPDNPHTNQGLLTYVEKAGNTNGIDVNDVLYTAPEQGSSKIVSMIARKNLHGEVTGYDELSKDVRPFPSDANDPKGNVLIELNIYSPELNGTNISSENYLKFWLVENAFEEKPLTIQQVSSDPDVEYPVWDIRNIIRKNSRRLPLGDLTDQRPNTVYANFSLSTNRALEDINGDNVVDLSDHDLIVRDFRQKGIYRSDIAGSKGTGLPDGIVNELDGSAFYRKYIELNPDKSIVNPYAFKEDFETGDYSRFNWELSGDEDWEVNTMQHYSGSFSAQAGLIGNNQKSTLKVTIDCLDGYISFYYRVSCEDTHDKLEFFIDGDKQGDWSGDRDWAQVSFPVTTGTRTFEWSYTKDGSVSDGNDTAWIDDIEFLLN